MRPDASARIDMVELLGERVRFAKEARYLDHSSWLGRGIDSWVYAAIACLRSLLLSGSRETSTIQGYSKRMRKFFAFLVEGRSAPLVSSPSQLFPLHLHEFAGWIRKRHQLDGGRQNSARGDFNGVKAIIMEMLAQGFILGEPSRFSKRGQFPQGPQEASKQTSLSEAEQERLAGAIKRDLVAVHHGRLSLNASDIQALRFVLVAHRQGTNLTPLLELHRDTLAPGILPSTVLLRTVKHRSKTVKVSHGRTTASDADSQAVEEYVAFPLAEGAVLQQAIAETAGLVAEAPTRYKSRIWLYRALRTARSTQKGSVTCLTESMLRLAVIALVKRHRLLGDDGSPLRLNVSRLRKTFFDRAFRLSDGDIVATANLLGNTPRVSASSYPSMSEQRKAEAATFLNTEFTAMMRPNGQSMGGASSGATPPRVVSIKPFKADTGAASLPTPTAVASCTDTANGEHAPRDGLNHCDRYVMCLFCSNFAIVGAVDELWRLFSFQLFAKSELAHIDEVLGQQRTEDDALEDLRDRYRLAIPYIDDFTKRMFPASRVSQARAKTAAGLHPYWAHLMTLSGRARTRQPGMDRPPSPPTQAGLGGRRDS